MIEHRKFISREMVRAEGRKLFVFGDNLKRTGLGGQAREMRGEPNAVGIPTKHSPHNHPSAFFTDADFELARPRIDEAFSKLQGWLEKGGVVVWPEDGVGTGRADLEMCAPTIFAYIKRKKTELEYVLS